VLTTNSTKLDFLSLFSADQVFVQADKRELVRTRLHQRVSCQ